MDATYEKTLVGPDAAWSAVACMALCVAVLIASELMSVSLLTPIAADLGLTEGQAGQAISISGLFAVVTRFEPLLTKGKFPLLLELLS